MREVRPQVLLPHHARSRRYRSGAVHVSQVRSASVLRMNHRHGNWASGVPPAVPPALPSAFETRVRELSLNTATYVECRELRRWCEANRNKCYIPEWLFKALGITVKAD